MIFVVSILDSTSTTSFNSLKKIFFFMIPEGDPREKNREDHFFTNKVENYDQGPSLILIDLI